MSTFPDICHTTQANVRHTEDIIELILDANRNRCALVLIGGLFGTIERWMLIILDDDSLLGLDLKVSICTLGLTTGALVAGLFGMVRPSSLLSAKPKG